MFISDKAQQSHIAKTGYVYLLISLFCVLFGAVYERFSHEVYSGYMIYAFVFPLAGGALPFMSMSLFGCRHLPGRLPLNIYNAGIATVTVGSIMEGVLEIYGTTNDLLRFYWYIGIGLVIVGILLYIFGMITAKKDDRK